jgi:O-methyltransferase involved in polyketide biosynthesis
LNEIPADRPVMIVLEGLLYYLTADQVGALLRRLTDHFSTGRLAFDASNRFGIELMRYQPLILATGASLNWGLDDPREIERQNPRLRCMRDLSLLGSPFVDKMDYAVRWMCRMYGRIPAFGRMSQALLYRFD